MSPSRKRSSSSPGCVRAERAPLSAIADFRQARPRVELRGMEVDTPAGQDLVARHDLDIAVIRPSGPSAVCGCVRGVTTSS
jgi:hypothetical protein